MWILGVSCYYHDSAAALLQDGVLVGAAQEERFTRRKHDYAFPTHAIRFCLDRAGIAGGDLDYVVFYEKPYPKFERIMVSLFASSPRSWRAFREAMIGWFDEKLWVRNILAEKLGIPRERVLFVEHHVSHAASAFFSSPFDEAAILSVDGVGEWTTTTIGRGRAGGPESRSEITLDREIRFPHSLGLLYSAFTAFLGFEVNEGEYKVMGMAPYGEPRYADKVERLLRVSPDGAFALDMDYFSYHYSDSRTFTPRFEGLFGPARKPDDGFTTARTNLRAKPDGDLVRRSQHYADVAASIQRVLEETLLKQVRHLHAQTGLRKLCLAGGVALNSVANGRLLRETPFEEIFVQPAAGDAGGALGAALYAWRVLLQQSRPFVMEHCYWGAEYPDGAVRDTLNARDIPFVEYGDDAALLDRVTDALVHGNVVGWFQGRFEWGPRALGNRSIMADPRRAEMKEIVNTKIKFREPFRPFAPVILEQHVDEYFDGDGLRQYPPRFMLLVAPVKPDKRDLIPAVTHVDGSGRLQTIRAESNPRYFGLIDRFRQATSVPVLLNTSFNLKGEPIVSTPGDALDTFMRSGLDLLVLDRFVVDKSAIP